MPAAQWGTARNASVMGEGGAGEGGGGLVVVCMLRGHGGGRRGTGRKAPARVRRHARKRTHGARRKRAPEYARARGDAALACQSSPARASDGAMPQSRQRQSAAPLAFGAAAAVTLPAAGVVLCGRPASKGADVGRNVTFEEALTTEAFERFEEGTRCGEKEAAAGACASDSISAAVWATAADADALLLADARGLVIQVKSEV